MFTVKTSNGYILMMKIRFMITIKNSDVRMFYHFFVMIIKKQPFRIK